MISGIGVDIELVDRFKDVDENFLRLVFSADEIEYCEKKKNPSVSFAGKFCVKEAVIKAVEDKILIKDIEVLNGGENQPEVYIKGQLNKNIFCSISHSGDYAIAYVVVENGN